MYVPHDAITTPDRGSYVWRYMNLERLLSLLSSNALHLSRIDKFTDPWEGSWPTPFVEAIRKNWGSDHSEPLLQTTTNMKQAFFVNCWHESEHESAALWDQYGTKCGFAIRSTVERLITCCSDDVDTYIGRIRYIDFELDDVDEVNLFIPPFLKRKSFEHEKEVRIMQFLPPHSEGRFSWEKAASAQRLRVDLSALIETLFLSPTMPSWVEESIRTLFAKFDMETVAIRKSDLYAKVIY